MTNTIAQSKHQRRGKSAIPCFLMDSKSAKTSSGDSCNLWINLGIVSASGRTPENLDVEFSASIRSDQREDNTFFHLASSQADLAGF
jgi:hypothetical protein